MWRYSTGIILLLFSINNLGQGIAKYLITNYQLNILVSANWNYFKFQVYFVTRVERKL